MVYSSKHLVFATKWQNRIAQGFSAGSGENEFALKGRPNDFSSTFIYSRRFKSCIGGTQRVESESYSGALSGRICWALYAGLKPWAILFCHFVAVDPSTPRDKPTRIAGSSLPGYLH
jgi:hypothetical protein